MHELTKHPGLPLTSILINSGCYCGKQLLLIALGLKEKSNNFMYLLDLPWTHTHMLYRSDQYTEKAVFCLINTV